MPIYPNVPNVPGVPPLLRDPLAGALSIALLVRDGFNLLFGNAAPWGIFRDGVPVVVADSVVSLDYRQTWYIATFPLENGAFESYDKVQTPFDARVRFASGGSIAERQDLLDSIAAIADDVLLYDVVTPEVVYVGVNVAHYDYRRQAMNGAGLLTVDVWLQQVRVTATAQFSNTKSPTAAAPTHGGPVQPIPATPAEVGLATGVR